jgi:hypothetical protein
MEVSQLVTPVALLPERASPSPSVPTEWDVTGTSESVWMLCPRASWTERCLITCAFFIIVPLTSVRVQACLKSCTQAFHYASHLPRDAVNCFANMAGVGDHMQAPQTVRKLSYVLHRLNKLLKIHWPMKSMEEIWWDGKELRIGAVVCRNTETNIMTKSANK